MKNIILIAILAIAVNTGFAQMPNNFVGKDCTGQQHDFFAELDQGKVIVLCWVMPCAGCISPAQTTHDIVKSYQAQYPGKVLFYLVDDYSNTNCTSLGTWGDQHKMPASLFSARFSSQFIVMTDYGKNGMPKVVIVGGKDHKVYYNANNEVEAELILNSINSAIEQTTSVQEQPKTDQLHLMLNPNPSTTNETVLSFSLTKSSSVVVDVISESGSVVKSVSAQSYDAGTHKTAINTSELPSGTYFVRVFSNVGVDVVKCIVVR